MSAFSMEFVVRPPNALRPGFRMRVPVVVGVRVEGDMNRNEEPVLFLSLRDASGQKPAAGLSGETSDNVHSRDYSVSRGYSKFEGLSIAAPGEYRIRVYLSVTTEGGTVAKHYIDSSVIRVHAGAGPGQGASPAQVQVLRSLVRENLAITEERIASWAA